MCVCVGCGQCQQSGLYGCGGVTLCVPDSVCVARVVCVGRVRLPVYAVYIACRCTVSQQCYIQNVLTVWRGPALGGPATYRFLQNTCSGTLYAYA